MPDMTLCQSTTCPVRAECYRNAQHHRANEYAQAYAVFEADRGRECFGFIERGTKA